MGAKNIHFVSKFVFQNIGLLAPGFIFFEKKNSWKE